MDKIEQYRAHLQQMCDWESFLLAESRLPGPRSNLELAQAAADEGDAAQFNAWLALDATAAPANTPAEFLPVCGALGLGRLLAEGDRSVLPRLRAAANDSRWRLREAAAMALQRWGETDMAALLEEMENWAGGSRYEQRAAVAALCEPPLLRDPAAADRTLSILDGIMATIPGAADRREDDFLALRKGLGYCWSVAVVAAPARGRALLEKWAAIDDPDARWIVRENLSKNRLIKLDAVWVARLGAEGQCSVNSRSVGQ
jgi:hypothetical protein